jgi:hypothetical protein
MTCECSERQAIIDVLNAYEAIRVYRDRHLRTADGWRIIHRHFDVQITLGDINVLRPA